MLFATLVIGTTALAQQGPPATPVVVVEARNMEMAPVRWAAGTVVSLDDADIAAEEDGRLLSVANEGDQVVRGDVLARLDDVLIKAGLQVAEAEVAGETANLNFLEREVERLQRLARQNNAAQTQLDQTMAQRDRSQYDLVAARARLQAAKERLEKTQIRAPFAGVVALRNVRVGEWVNSGDIVLKLVDPNSLEIEVAAPVSLRPFLVIGQPLALEAEGRQGEAHLKVVVPVADPASRLISVRLAVNGNEWLAGQPVKVALPMALPQQVLAVPRDALVFRRGGSYLYRVNAESVAEQVPVELGMAAGDFIQVIGGLNPGDQVITRGNERMRPGQTVNVTGGTPR